MPILLPDDALISIPGLTAATGSIAALIDVADSHIASELGFRAPVEGQTETLVLSQYERFLRGPGGRELQLPFYPVVVDDTHLISVTDDPTELFVEDDLTYLVDPEDYDVRPGGIVRLVADATWCSWSETDEEYPILVNWWAGYDPDTMPARLRQGVVELVAQLYTERATLTKTTVNTGRQTITPRVPRKLPDNVLDLIAPYRLIGALL